MSYPTLLNRRHLLIMGASAPFAIPLGGCNVLNQALDPLVGRIVSLQLHDISQGFLNISMGLNIFNPNPLGLPDLGLTLGLDLADQAIATFGTQTLFSLPGEGSTDVNLGVGIHALNTITTLISLRNASAIPYSLNGQADTPQLAGLTLPLRANGTVSLS